MLQPPARMVPSNAPPLQDRDNGNVYEASRILQEHSGNRQHNEAVFSNDVDFKYNPPALDENACVGTSFAYPQPQPFAFLPLVQPYGEGLRLGYDRSGYGYPSPEEEARICADAEKLYNRLCKTEGYMKYRSKQGDGSKGNEQKWPTNLEKAFCRGLVQYPPMGRRKQSHKRKPHGRNELISDCIFQLTGQLRNRKKVSSHIQVIKAWVAHDPAIMKWFSTEDMAGKDPRHDGHHHSGKRMSHYPVRHSGLNMRNTVPSLARSEFLKIRRAKRDLNVFHPVDFQMFVQRNFHSDEGEDRVERLHTYTKSISNPLGEDIVLSNVQELHQQYPLLASIHARRPLDCTILDAEASLAFPTETWKNKDGSPLPGIELGIYFLCVSAHLPTTPIAPTARDRGYQVVVHNAFYENGVCAKEHSGSGEARIEDSDRGVGCVETRIKFGSTFWAKTLGRLASRLLDKAQDHSEEIAAYLSGIHAVQEVVAVSEYGAERLLVIHWRFRHSSTTVGRTSWRRVILPEFQEHEQLQRQQLQQGQFSRHPHAPPSLHTSLTASFQELNTHVGNEAHFTQIQPQPPSLQPPFEYDNSNSSSGSAVSSATWSGSFDDTSIFHRAPPLESDGLSTSIQHEANTFDFTAGTLHLSYQDDAPAAVNAISFDPDMPFDSSAFQFEMPAAAVVRGDAGLNDYASQQWCTTYPDFFDESQAVTGTENFAAEASGSGVESQVFDAFGAHPYEQQPQHEYDIIEQDERRRSQAYGGAGQALESIPSPSIDEREVVKEEMHDVVMEHGGDALAALADASFLAGALPHGGAVEEDDGVV